MSESNDRIRGWCCEISVMDRAINGQRGELRWMRTHRGRRERWQVAFYEKANIRYQPSHRSTTNKSVQIHIKYTTSASSYSISSQCHITHHPPRETSSFTPRAKHLASLALSRRYTGRSPSSATHNLSRHFLNSLSIRIWPTVPPLLTDGQV